MHAELPGWLARRGIAQHLVNEAHALAYTGRYTEARQLLEPAVERALATSAMGAWIWFNMALGEIARDTGRAHETIRRFREVADVAPRVGQDATLVWAHVGVAQGHLLLGQCGPAAAALDLADQAGDSPVATSFGTRERDARLARRVPRRPRLGAPPDPRHHPPPPRGRRVHLRGRAAARSRPARLAARGGRSARGARRMHRRPAGVDPRRPCAGARRARRAGSARRDRALRGDRRAGARRRGGGRARRHAPGAGRVAAGDRRPAALGRDRRAGRRSAHSRAGQG